MNFNDLFILQLGQNRSKILHYYQQDLPAWLPKIKEIMSFFYAENNLTSRLYNISMKCMHTKVWSLVKRIDTQRKNVLKTFKSNKIDLIEYDQTIIPIHVNNNHW